MRLLVNAAAGAVEQHDAPPEFSQHIGEVRRHRKRTAKAEQIDVARLRQYLDGGFELVLMGGLAQRHQR